MHSGICSLILSQGLGPFCSVNVLLSIACTQSSTFSLRGYQSWTRGSHYYYPSVQGKTFMTRIQLSTQPGAAGNVSKCHITAYLTMFIWQNVISYTNALRKTSYIFSVVVSQCVTMCTVQHVMLCLYCMRSCCHCTTCVNTHCVNWQHSMATGRFDKVVLKMFSWLKQVAPS